MVSIPNNFELANATQVRVLETNVLHASDVIYWLDGASAVEQGEMARIEIPLNVEFRVKPRALKFLHSHGKTAFWQTSSDPMFVGVANEGQRSRPVQVPYLVAGTVTDPSRRYNPAVFELSLGAGDGKAVVLYPSPLGVVMTSGGILQGRILWVDSGRPLIWGLLHLEVALGLDESLTFQAQTDAYGNFRLACNRLPQLPLSVTAFNATLRIQGNPMSSAEVPLNTANLVTLELESATAAGSFAEELAFTIRPGLMQRINSANKLFIAVQTV